MALHTDSVHIFDSGYPPRINTFCFRCKEVKNQNEMHEERHYGFDTVNYTDATRFCIKCHAIIQQKIQRLTKRLHKWKTEFDKTGDKKAEQNWKRALKDWNLFLETRQ